MTEQKSVVLIVDDSASARETLTEETPRPPGPGCTPTPDQISYQ